MNCRAGLRVRLALLVALALLPAVALAQEGTPTAGGGGPRPTTPIEHTLVLIQENHSFDNYFGTYPGADGFPPDTCVPVDPFDASNTDCIEPFHIGENDVEVADPDHSKRTAVLQYNEGKMDGFVYALNQRSQDGRMAMGYYDDRDLPYYWNLADRYVLFDRFFSSAHGGSLINHFYAVAAQAIDRTQPGKPVNHIETIFDRLEAAGVSWKFYVQNYEPNLTYRTVDQYPGNRGSQIVWVPLLMMDRFIDDPELNSHIVDMDQYYEDVANDTLPAVAFMVPSGPSEHPPSNIQSGQRFVRSLIQPLMRSASWDSSMFMVVYDDWGGWYDHVAPPVVDEYGLGFRVPGFIVGPYVRQGVVDHTVLDYTSILKFIEENWGIEPLTERDAQANSFAGAFDFSQPPRSAEFIPWDRPSASAVERPQRRVVYIAYGAAIGAGLLLAAGIALGAARRAGWRGRERER